VPRPEQRDLQQVLRESVNRLPPEQRMEQVQLAPRLRVPPVLPGPQVSVASLSTFCLSQSDLVVDLLDEIADRFSSHVLVDRSVQRDSNVSAFVVPLLKQLSPGGALDESSYVQLRPFNVLETLLLAQRRLHVNVAGIV
jgi:hypothetical protein